MEDRKIYEDIALRTQGDIYIGVVGPVRTGKSTFIKRFMETMVIPNIENVYRRERARDELPQSASGRTIMTAEPKFVPEEAVTIPVSDHAQVQVRLVDCVGYMVNGAMGLMEGELERMVTTPWFDYEIPMTQAAEIGTKKVIREHSTIGIVVTTDGTVTDIPREDYLDAEERVIRELKQLEKPFVVLLNSSNPDSDRTESIRQDIEQRYDVSCVAANCLELDKKQIFRLLQLVLHEFPLNELDLHFPSWVDALAQEHEIKQQLFSIIRNSARQLLRLRDVEKVTMQLNGEELIRSAQIMELDPGMGLAVVQIQLPQELFFATLTKMSGLDVHDEGDLMDRLVQLSRVKTEYDKVAEALKEVEECGYGIVVPPVESLVLEEPEITKQAGRYGVRLKASAPSIHMIRADIETEVAPIVGGEKQSEDMIRYLLQEYEGDSKKIWQANIFGKSLHELVREDLNTKLKRMPEDAREKLRETLQRIINEGSGGLICIIL